MARQWKKRTTAPEKDNKYYLKTPAGYNKCILGNSSTNKEKNRQSANSCIPNCVGYVYGRSLEIAKKTTMDLPTCNAEDWNDTCKWQKGNTPLVGAIACWRSGKNWNSSDGCGHVAVVEEVNADGSFLISESGWSSFYFRTRTIPKNCYYGSGLTFETFLYNPYAANNYIVTADSFLPTKGYWGLGDKDERVGKLCQFYYDTFPAYGDVLHRNKKDLLGNYYGANAKAWTQEFQRRTKINPDGKVGIITYTELKKYGFKY